MDIQNIQHKNHTIYETTFNSDSLSGTNAIEVALNIIKTGSEISSQFFNEELFSCFSKCSLIPVKYLKYACYLLCILRSLAS